VPIFSEITQITQITYFSSKSGMPSIPSFPFVPSPGRPAPAPPQSKRGKPQKPNETAKIQPNRIKSNLTQSKSIALLFPGHSNTRKFLHSKGRWKKKKTSVKSFTTKASSFLLLHSVPSGLSVGDSRLVQIVLGHFDVYLVADGNADEIFAHFARDVREDFVAVGQFDPEHGAGEHLCDGSRQFDVLFSRHGEKQVRQHVATAAEKIKPVLTALRALEGFYHGRACARPYSAMARRTGRGVERQPRKNANSREWETEFGFRFEDWRLFAFIRG
jgi:hypothetical protein